MKTRAAFAALIAACFPLLCHAVSGKAIGAFKAGRYEQAAKLLAPEAEAGDAEAQFYLAMSLRFMLPRDQKESRANPSETDPRQQEIHRWFEKAALSGHVESMREYALDFDAGAGVQVDFDQALQWMQKADGLGDRGARNKLISWYDTGHIVPPSYARFKELDAVNAASNAKMRSDLQQLSATLQAAQAYIGAQNAANTNDAAAAEGGDPRAARRLAEAATYVDDKSKQDCAAAQRYYLMAGDAGDPHAYYALGVQFYRGHCQAQDLPRARELFAKSAEGANLLAIYNLAKINLFGHGQAPDYPEAYYWLKLLEALDPAWLKEEPAMLLVAKRKASPTGLSAADARVAGKAPALLELQAKTRQKLTRRPVKSAGDASATDGWSYDLALVDDSGTCSANVRGNCDYVPFEVRLAIRNPLPTSLDCKLALVMTRPGDKEATTYQRRYVLFPDDELKPRIGRVAGRVDVPASGLACSPIAAPTLADQTCAMRILPGTDIEDFLEGSPARRKKQAGRVTLELTFDALKGKPANVAVKSSSGFAELDAVAVKYAGATSFRTNCTGTPHPLTIAVE